MNNVKINIKVWDVWNDKYKVYVLLEVNNNLKIIEKVMEE